MVDEGVGEDGHGWVGVLGLLGEGGLHYHFGGAKRDLTEVSGGATFGIRFFKPTTRVPPSCFEIVSFINNASRVLGTPKSCRARNATWPTRIAAQIEVAFSRLARITARPVRIVTRIEMVSLMPARIAALIEVVSPRPARIVARPAGIAAWIEVMSPRPARIAVRVDLVSPRPIRMELTDQEWGYA
ncbi:unnamed protein product [Prunus armeniaca]